MNHARQAYGPGGAIPLRSGPGDHTLLAEQRRECDRESFSFFLSTLSISPVSLSLFLCVCYGLGKDPSPDGIFAALCLSPVTAATVTVLNIKSIHEPIWFCCCNSSHIISHLIPSCFSPIPTGAPLVYHLLTPRHRLETSVFGPVAYIDRYYTCTAPLRLPRYPPP